MLVKYYKLDLETDEMVEEFIDQDESTVLVQSNPIMEFEQRFQNNEILSTQEAVNFLLMGEMGAFNLYINTNNEGVNGMGVYLANQIYRGRLDYDEVIARYPQFKDDIDSRLDELAKKDGLTYKY